MPEELLVLIAAHSGWSLLIGPLILFSAVPQLVLEVLLLIYPKDHPRRLEHRAELKAVPLWRRPSLVLESGISVLFEATPLRISEVRRRRAAAAGRVIDKAGAAAATASGTATASVVLMPVEPFDERYLEAMGLIPDERYCVRLRDLRGLWPRQIAHLLGMEQAWVESTLRIADAKMKITE